jgi:hypothetical protein
MNTEFAIITAAKASGISKGGVDGHLPARNKVEQLDLDLISQIYERNKLLISQSPCPTRQDIHKLLALQGHCLNEVGLMFLGASETSKVNKQFYIDYALKLLQVSRLVYSDLLKDPKFDTLPPEIPAK